MTNVHTDEECGALPWPPGIVAASLALAACGTSGPKSAGSGSGGGATAWALSGGDEATFRASFDAWNKAHPDEKITPTFFSNDAYKQKMRTAVGPGSRQL